MSALITEAELAADYLRLDVDKVAELRRKHRWAHVRLGRFEVRYTADQVAAIIAQQTRTPSKPATPPTVAGQTTRSRRRSA